MHVPSLFWWRRWFPGVTTPPPDGDDLDDIDVEVQAGEGRGRQPSAPSTPQIGTGSALERSATAPPGSSAETDMAGWEIAGVEVAKAEEVRNFGLGSFDLY